MVNEEPRSFLEQVREAAEMGQGEDGRPVHVVCAPKSGEVGAGLGESKRKMK